MYLPWQTRVETQARTRPNERTEAGLRILIGLEKPLPQGPWTRCQSLRQVVLDSTLLSDSGDVHSPRDPAGRGPDLPTKARVPRRLPTGMPMDMVKPKKPGFLDPGVSRPGMREQAAGGAGKRPLACQLQWLAAVLAWHHGTMAPWHSSKASRGFGLAPHLAGVSVANGQAWPARQALVSSPGRTVVKPPDASAGRATRQPPARPRPPGRPAPPVRPKTRGN